MINGDDGMVDKTNNEQEKKWRSMKGIPAELALKDTLPKPINALPNSRQLIDEFTSILASIRYDFFLTNSDNINQKQFESKGEYLERIKGYENPTNDSQITDQQYQTIETKLNNAQNLAMLPVEIANKLDMTLGEHEKQRVLPKLDWAITQEIGEHFKTIAFQIAESPFLNLKNEYSKVTELFALSDKATLTAKNINPHVSGMESNV
jgi:hypothetical protein